MSLFPVGEFIHGQLDRGDGPEQVLFLGTVGADDSDALCIQGDGKLAVSNIDFLTLDIRLVEGKDGPQWKDLGDMDDEEAEEGLTADPD